MGKKKKKNKRKKGKKKSEINLSSKILMALIGIAIVLLAANLLYKESNDDDNNEIKELSEDHNALIDKCLHRSDVDTGLEANGLLQITLRDRCEDEYYFRVAKITVKYKTFRGDKYLTIEGPWIVNNEALPLTLNTGLRGVMILDAYHLKEGIEVLKN